MIKLNAFQIETRLNNFAHWVKHYTVRSRHETRLSSPAWSEITFLPAEIKRMSEGGEMAFVVVKAQMTPPLDPEEEEILGESEMGDSFAPQTRTAIYFQVMEIAAGKRIEVTPFFDPSFSDYAENLLNALGSSFRAYIHDLPDGGDFFGRLGEDKQESEGERASKPWDSSLKKLEELRELRRARIKNGEVTMMKTAACEQIGISPKTAKEHDPGLWLNWDDPDYP